MNNLKELQQESYNEAAILWKGLNHYHKEMLLSTLLEDCVFIPTRSYVDANGNLLKYKCKDVVEGWDQHGYEFKVILQKTKG